ncbi:hypothetical protein ACFWY6_40720 [Streptomyces sp. NPDC059037]|uniref:hypothetical protein n=1 Tax=Streptomyces sp. NPDC059037 TaxID=3346710 RepID=UPI00368013D3
MSASRTYLLDPLYETETLKLPPSRTDLAVIGAGVALSVTHGVVVPGILGTLTCIVPAALAGALSLVKTGGSTVVERVTRRGGHALRKRALARTVGEYESEQAPSATDAEGALPHHAVFTKINDLLWHEREGYAFPQGGGRLLAAFEWVTDGAALKDGAHRDRAHDALASFLEWVAATGHGSCVRVVHAVSPYLGERDIRAEQDGDLAASYRQLMGMVNAACDVHTTVILLSVPAYGPDVEEETAWVHAAFEQAQVCGIDTGQMWDRSAWDTALSTIRGSDLYEIHDSHFRSGDFVTASAEVADFRRGGAGRGLLAPDDHDAAPRHAHHRRRVPAAGPAQGREAAGDRGDAAHRDRPRREGREAGEDLHPHRPTGRRTPRGGHLRWRRLREGRRPNHDPGP